MSEQKGIFESLPHWVEITLLIVFIFGFGFTVYLGVYKAMWAIVGPMILAEMWKRETFGNYSRSERPKMFWLFVAGLGLMSCMGALDIYEYLAGPIV